MNNTEITSVEALADGVSVKLTFADGTTLRMARRSFESGSWKKGTHPGLVIR